MVEALLELVRKLLRILEVAIAVCERRGPIIYAQNAFCCPTKSCPKVWDGDSRRKADRPDLQREVLHPAPSRAVGTAAQVARGGGHVT